MRRIILVEVFKRIVNDLLKYREYILYATKSELKIQLSSTFLGYLWWILDPLLYMLIYMLLVMLIFKRGEENFPIFIFCALIPWKWTVSSIVDSTSSIKSKVGVLEQVYIPKPVLPLIRVLVNTVKYFFGIVILLILIAAFKIPFSLHNIEFIVVFIIHFLFIFGLSLILSHVGIFFKDIRNILIFTVRLWFYLSPGLYSLERIPQKFQFLWWMNPMTTFFLSYRNIFLYDTFPLYKQLLPWALFSIILIFIGLKYLYKFDKQYMKVI